MKITMTDVTENAEIKIAEYAAICYAADTSPDRNTKRVKSLMKQRHLATLRFASATFLVEGISRVCSHQIVRHPHLSFLQRSQRYCKDEDTGFVIPESLKGNLAYSDALRNTHEIYLSLIESGVRKEDARFILPQASVTEMYITGNFQAWFDFLLRRLDKHAQWEIRLVASMIYGYLRKVAPSIFNAETLGFSDEEIYSSVEKSTSRIAP